MFDFNVAVLTPTTGNVRIEYAQSLARLMMYFAQVPIFKDEKNVTQSIVPDYVEGSGIAENYARMITKYVLQDEGKIKWTHILCVEDDMNFRADILHILASRKVEIVAANYTTNKGNKQRFVNIGLDDKPIITDNKSIGLVEAKYITQGMTLIRREVFEKIPKPWFMQGYDPEHDQYVHQDYYFSKCARENGFKLWVDQDASKLVTHVGPRGYSYKDMNNVIELTSLKEVS